jgi:hypothetical protein
LILVGPQRSTSGSKEQGAFTDLNCGAAHLHAAVLLHRTREDPLLILLRVRGQLSRSAESHVR